MTTVIEEPHPKTGFVESEQEKLPPPATKKHSHAADNAFAFAFLSPQLVGLIVFMLGPLVFAIILAFSNWDGFGTRSFAGINNFVTVMKDHQIQISARNTLWYTVMCVPGTMISAFLVAYMLGRVRGKSFYRVFYFAPVVTSSVAVAAIWLWLFNPDISPLNNALKSIGLPAPDWLQNPKTVIPAFAIVGIWQGLGYQVVMFMAGLENVPKSLMEAADIDGASEWGKMVRITIPLLSPTILFLSITSIIASFQTFDYVFLFMGSQAPEASHMIVYDLYQKAFVEFNFGVGSAVAVLLFLALLAVTGLQLIAQKRWVHYTE
jgi:multiple sugar transport system permease protein